MDDVSLTAYAAGLLGEYLAQHWQDRLAAVRGGERVQCCRRPVCASPYARLALLCDPQQLWAPCHVRICLLQALNLPEDLPQRVHAAPPADYGAQVRPLVF